MAETSGMEILARLPKGAVLTEESWQQRHRILTWILWAHVPALMLLGLIGPMPVWEAFALPLLPAALAGLAGLGGSNGARAQFTSLGLISSSFIVIELSGGQQSAHLHIFAMLTLVALYQTWMPLLLTIGVVVVHHLSLGLLAVDRVFSTGTVGSSMPGMTHGGLTFLQALTMTLSHAGIVVLQVIGILLLWHFAEQTEAQVRQAAVAAEQARLATIRTEQEAETRQAEQQLAEAATRRELALSVGREVEAIRGNAASTFDALTTISHTLDGLTQAVNAVATRSQEAAQSAVTAKATAHQAAEEAHRLERSTGEIAQVNALIAQLAEQTNLLSLNATIEAARAGEAGRGFAVVAGEVKALAGETSTSAGKVGDVIGGVINETDAVVRSVSTASTAIETIQAIQTDIAGAVEGQTHTLSDINRQIATATDAAREIHSALDRLAAAASSL